MFIKRRWTEASNIATCDGTILIKDNFTLQNKNTSRIFVYKKKNVNKFLNIGRLQMLLFPLRKVSVVKQ